jgi:hypothetical protein
MFLLQSKFLMSLGRHLDALGYKLITVAYWAWDDLQGAGPVAQLAYLESLLAS